MSPIKIKVLGSTDLVILENIPDGIFDSPVIPSQARAFLESDLHHIVVAMDVERVVGMASAVTMLHPDKEPMVFINEVGVHDDYLRRGIGRRLTERLLKTVSGSKKPDIWLATEDDNTAARALYRSLDARETKGIVVYDWGHAMDDD